MGQRNFYLLIYIPSNFKSLSMSFTGGNTVIHKTCNIVHTSVTKYGTKTKLPLLVD